MLKVNDTIHGFTVTRVREIEELKGVMVEMKHNCGAQLCWFNNKDKNKLFSVTFKTLPENSTGVFHMLEHSVLCGSKKYPVREPFVELLKSSMNTFLNAMTFPDKTMYPVSSRNEQDYLNLMSVYLDAVFAPAILENPNIFYQEGWHIEMNEGIPSYKGVVFNEMKGAMSDVDEVIRSKMDELLFGKQCYGYNSGGDPAVIPTLTYERFIEEYHRFYHPSNALFYLDGDIPLEKTLSMISEYLDVEPRLDQPHMTVPKISSLEETHNYPLGEEESLDKHAHLSLGKIIGTWEDRIKTMAATILADILTGSNEAPLSKALIKSGIAQDVEMEIDDSIAYPIMILCVRNINDEDSDQIRAIINNVITNLIHTGIDKQMLEASINSMAFKVKQMGEPQGLIRGMTSLVSWLHGGDPAMNLVFDEAIQTLRDMAKTDAFEQLLKELFSDEGMNILHTLPSHDKDKEMREEEKARLDAIVAKWSEEDFKKNEELNTNLALWQRTPDTEAQINTLPKLTLDEVSDEFEYPDTVITDKNVRILTHHASTNGIVYIHMYFKLTDFSLEDLQRLSLMTVILPELPTKSHDALALQQAVKIVIGRLNYTLRSFGQKDKPNSCIPMFMVNCAVLEENLEEAKKLVFEILNEVIFDRTRIKEGILQLNEQVKQNEMGSGHAIAMMSTISHYEARSAVTENTAGHSFVEYLSSLCDDHLDDKVEELGQFFEQTLPTIVTEKRLTLSVTLTDDLNMDSWISDLNEGIDVPDTCVMSYDNAKDKIRIPAGIGYSAEGYHLSKENLSYDGSLRVVAHLLTFGYLWNTVRVQGGAYGTGLSVRRSGSIASYSYRDPDPRHSLEVNHHLSEALKDFINSDESIEKYIIATLSALEPLLSPAALGGRGDEDYFEGYTYEDTYKLRQEILHTTKEELKKWYDLLDDFANKGETCIVGHEGVLKEV